MISWDEAVVSVGSGRFLGYSELLIDGKPVPIAEPVHLHGHHRATFKADCPDTVRAELERRKQKVLEMAGHA